MLTANELKSVGITPCHIFGELLKCNSLEEAKRKFDDFNANKPKKNTVRMIEGSIWHFLCTSPHLTILASMEGDGIASNSERRRWILNKSVEINRDTDWNPDEKMPTLISLLFHPNGRRKTTIL